ncbi:MAG TPA: Holliday junction branch migration protein RuvA [Desulfitobacteriaceae bacterium]|nr:Holliday junction branch migration protein RuvA [Desulfitobacteriaceae bacterium]
MIGMLRGRVWEVQTENLILDVQGVGYQLTVPAGLLAKVRSGQDLVLYTYVHVREDDLSFYGFDSLAEKRLFLLMLGVSGIGPKASLAMLSTFSAPEIRAAIVAENVTLLTQVPGIGRKTAQRLILELKEKLREAAAADKTPGVRTGEQHGFADALETLLALGYNMAEARQALDQLENETGLNSEDKIKRALRILAKGVEKND